MTRSTVRSAAAPVTTAHFTRGLLVKNGTTRGHKQALCRACGQSIALNTGTAYFELDAAPALFDTAMRASAEGDSLRATGESST